MVQDSAWLLFPAAGSGFRLHRVEPSRGAIAARGATGGIRTNRETLVFAKAEDDAEIAETGLAQGKTRSHLRGIGNLTPGTGGEVELGDICGIDEEVVMKIRY